MTYLLPFNQKVVGLHIGVFRNLTCNLLCAFRWRETQWWNLHTFISNLKMRMKFQMRTARELLSRPSHWERRSVLSRGTCWLMMMLTNLILCPFQEMCLSFILYYPRTELAGCYSMTPVKEFFETFGVRQFYGLSILQLENIFLSNG